MRQQRIAGSAMIALILLAALAATIFAWRGPVRGLSNPSDFILVYGPARTWLLGGNPYDIDEIDRVWKEANGPDELAPSRRTAPGLLYPPTTLLTLAPFAALNWPAAHRVWLAANLLFFAASIWSIARIAGFTWRQRRTWMFIAAALLLAPVHTTFHHGQTPLYVMALMLLAFVSRRGAESAEGQRQRSRSSSTSAPSAPLRETWSVGLLLGISSAIKPHIGLPALALEGVRWRWRSVIIGAAVLLIALLAAVLPMMMNDVPWLDSWRANLIAHRAADGGGAGDLSAANPDRHQMVNLQYPIAALTENKTLAEAVALLVCFALAVAFFLPPKRRMQRTSLLHALSMVATLSLMVAYHRFYDAVLLLIPLAWVIDELARRRTSALAWCAMLTLVPYFLNSATALVWLDETGRLPAGLTQAWLWQRLLLPHQGWALLVLAVCLLLSQRVGAGVGAGAGSADERR